MQRWESLHFFIAGRFLVKTKILKLYSDIKNEIMLEWKYSRKTFVYISLFLLSAVYSIHQLVQIIRMVMYLEFWKINIVNIFSGIFSVIMLLLPFVVWMISTTEEFFYYRRRKRMLFYYCFVNMTLAIVKYAVYGVSRVVIPQIMSFPVNDVLTGDILVWLARIVLITIVALVIAIIKINLFDFVRQDNVMAKVEDFNIKFVYDKDIDDDTQYNQKIIKDAETGEDVVFKYNDRFTHQIIEGASGTGKTSAAILKMVWGDFVTKYKNQVRRHSEYKKMIKAGEAFLIPDENGKINPEKIEAYSGFEDKLRDIKVKYLDCGYTAIGPDNDLCDKILKFADKFKFDYYIVDPETDDEGNYREHFKGINPYHISPGLSRYKYIEQVAMIAALVSEILKAVFDESGSTDPYFSGVNEAATVHISVVLMVGMPLVEGREAKITDLRYILYEFSRIKKYSDAVKKEYGIGNENPFNANVDYVEKSMLGEQKVREKLYGEATGLRNMLDRMLQLPNIKGALCSDDPIDFEEVLNEGKIVLVNYGVKYGATVAKGFGLFYVMMFHNQVIKRNPDDPALIPHFEIVDEFSMLMHSHWESVITWLRKYKLCFTAAFQSNSQFEKNDMTRYMGKVIQGVGQIITFGRLDGESSKIYSELSGKEEIDVKQTTVNQTSILSDNPSYQEGERVTRQREAYRDVSELRNLNFLEANVFTVRDAKVLPPILGKLYFVTKKEINRIKVKEEKWNDYVIDSDEFLANKPVSLERLSKEGIVVGELRVTEQHYGENTENTEKKENNDNNERKGIAELL